MKDYIDLVEQALFEVEDLRVSTEWDQEEGGISFYFTEPLAAQLHQLLEQLTVGQYTFGGEDLPLMTIVRNNAQQIPFKGLLDTINQTHRLGLERG
jgi:hypothetical protein